MKLSLVVTFTMDTGTQEKALELAQALTVFTSKAHQSSMDNSTFTERAQALARAIQQAGAMVGTVQTLRAKG